MRVPFSSCRRAPAQLPRVVTVILLALAPTMALGQDTIWTPAPMVRLGLSVHVEGRNLAERYPVVRATLLEYATLFEAYGAVMTVESQIEFAREDANRAASPMGSVLLELEGRGHHIGLHADLGGMGRTATNPLVFLNELTDERIELQATGLGTSSTSQASARLRIG